MNKRQLPAGIAPADHFLAGHDIAVTVLHSSVDGSTQGLVQLSLRVTEARAPDAKPVTLKPVRMSSSHARSLAEALTTWAALAEEQNTKAPSARH